MRTISILLALASTSLAHNAVTHFHIGNIGNGISDCVRQAASRDPITDVESPNMACNAVEGLAEKKCTVKAGDKIFFEWRVDPGFTPVKYPLKNGKTRIGVTDDSHKGPCSIYMKKVTDSASDEGVGDGWFKASEDSVDESGAFCSDRLRLANSPQPGLVPSNIEPGDYLFRAEILTLNDAGPASLGGKEIPQFYVGCVQVTVEGTSGVNPSTVKIPGYVTMNPPSPGLIFDIWNTNNFSSYIAPGPTPLSSIKLPIVDQGGPPDTTSSTSNRRARRHNHAHRRATL